MNDQVKIIDNYLDKHTFKTVQQALLSSHFPWYFNESKIVYSKKFHKNYSPVKGHKTDDQHQFTHLFFGKNAPWSSFTHHIAPVLNKINPKVWLRVKANLTSIYSKPLVGGWHYDIFNIKKEKNYIDNNETVAFLYLNTNNGYTLLENGDKVKSIENRFVTFPNTILHTGVSQTDTKIRSLINFNFCTE